MLPQLLKEHEGLFDVVVGGRQTEEEVPVAEVRIEGELLLVLLGLLLVLGGRFHDIVEEFVEVVLPAVDLHQLVLAVLDDDYLKNRHAGGEDG